MMQIESGKLFYNSLIHPTEDECRVFIQENEIYDALSKLCGSLRVRAKSLSEMALTGFPVTEETSPRLYSIYQKVLERLYCDQEYRLFVDFDYDLTAKSFGSATDGHMILVNSACLQELNDGELAALLGHEIGHILADHIQNREMLDSMDVLINKIPLAGDLAKKKLWSFFSKWMIASEYTADRAALIASGDIRLVASLLQKQVGGDCVDLSLNDILSQEVLPMPDKLGIFYVLMSQSFPTFGMVARVQELARWICSDGFRKEFPYLHYTSRLCMKEPPASSQEEEIMLLHKRAVSGNAIAQRILGRAYLLEDKGLPLAPETAVSLLTAASFLGDGEAMYLLSRAMKVGTAGMKMDENLQVQLLVAAGSRFPAAAKLPDGLTAFPILEDLPKLVRSYCKKRSNVLQCELNREEPGNPIETPLAGSIQDGFWISVESPVYAAEAKRADSGEIYGTAITSSGIYGRMSDEKYPFRIAWGEFLKGDLYWKEVRGQEYLCLEKRMFYLCGKSLHENRPPSGSLGELIVAIKSKNLDEGGRL